jgi:hypothetical protein
LSSVQAGFEIWDLPADGGAAEGGALGTSSFEVHPLSVLATAANGATGRSRVGTSPLIQWQDQFTIKYAGCTGATAHTYTVTPGNGVTPVTGNLAETPAGSGIYVATASPMIPGHEGSTIGVSLTCPGGATDAITAPVFIDPSGKVQTQNGDPIKGATVTLLRSASASGPFTTPAPGTYVPAGNVQTTDATGSFRWDVTGNTFYRVDVTAAGCSNGTTGPLPVPPPQVDLLIRLTCTGDVPGRQMTGSTGGTGTLPTVVKIRPGYPNPNKGYCADVTVTNNTSAAVDWNTSFPVPLNQKINQAWNMAYSQGGNPNVASNVRADAGSASWNKTLAPGASTHDVGFCTPFS